MNWLYSLGKAIETLEENAMLRRKLQIAEEALRELSYDDNYNIENRSHEWDTCDHHIEWAGSGSQNTPWDYARERLETVARCE